MDGTEITIFYSWQSDLPGNETRNLIQDSIKDAVRLLRDTVDVEADRDTQGEYGSPDIAQTIFSKIDACDIFIADVTAVCKYETIDKDGNVKIKLMPNPNVMLELGYATNVVGWENVICILNSDYGTPDNMPFDIANRRLTTYSLKEGKTKGDVKRYLRGIIQDTVENILGNGKRVKSGFSNLKVGSFVSENILPEIIPFEMSKSVMFKEHRSKIIFECAELLKTLKDKKITDISVEIQEQKVKENDTSELVTTKEGTILTPINPAFSLDLFKQYKVCINDDDKKYFVELCKRYLNEDIDENSELFIFGNLKRRSEFGISQTYVYEGTDEEKEKFDFFEMLDYQLHRLSLLDWYVSTFDGMLFIPLAIENKSFVYDEEVDVYLHIDLGKVMPILPSKELINLDMKGLEELIVEEDIIKELLLMRESSVITYDEDISYTIADAQSAINYRFSAAGVNGNPLYDEDDYERELSKYIAVPIENNNSAYLFTIKSLRANEKKWLGSALLLKPLAESFEISYLIKSKHSDGNLSGIITYKKQ
jgi:hypothetical protein